MRIGIFKVLALVIPLAATAACVPVAVEAPFAESASGRQNFVSSVTPGQTQISTAIAQYGKPTTISTSDNLYIWSGGFTGSGGSVYAKTNAAGVIVQAWADGPNGTESVVPPTNGSVSTPRPSATPTPVATASTQSAPVATRAAGTPTAAIAQQMLDYARHSDATAQEFFSRFGAPTLRDNTSPTGLFSANRQEETWTYGQEPNTSVFSNICNQAPFVWVTIFPQDNKVGAVRSNLLGGC